MKILDVEELQFLNESEVVTSTLLKWVRSKPDNKELKDVIDSYTKVFLYITNVQSRARQYEKLLSESRADKNRAILSRNKALDTALALQQENDELKKLQNLFK